MPSIVARNCTKEVVTAWIDQVWTPFKAIISTAMVAFQQNAPTQQYDDQSDDDRRSEEDEQPTSKKTKTAKQSNPKKPTAKEPSTKRSWQLTQMMTETM